MRGGDGDDTILGGGGTWAEVNSVSGDVSNYMKGGTGTDYIKGGDAGDAAMEPYRVGFDEKPSPFESNPNFVVLPVTDLLVALHNISEGADVLNEASGGSDDDRLVGGNGGNAGRGGVAGEVTNVLDGGEGDDYVKGGMAGKLYDDATGGAVENKLYGARDARPGGARLHMAPRPTSRGSTSPCARTHCACSRRNGALRLAQVEPARTSSSAATRARRGPVWMRPMRPTT